MFLRIVFGFFNNLFCWINGVVHNYFDPVRPPTKDLHEIARIEIERKLADIKILYNDYEFDSRKRKIVAQMDQSSVTANQQGDVPGDIRFQMNTESTREMVDSYDNRRTVIVQAQGFGDSDHIPQYTKVEFVCPIQLSPRLIYRGRIFGKKLVSLKKTQKNESILTRVAAELNHHENVLSHLFDFQNGVDSYTVSENFEHALSKYFVPEDLKHLARQVCNGVEYLHEKGIAHGKLEFSNVIVCQDRKRPTYKIANFEEAVINAPIEFLTEDVKELGKLLMVFRCNILYAKEIEIYRGTWNQSDDYCLCDMVEMNGEGCCTIQETKQHPLLWSVHETLMFVVEIVKTMEPYLEARNYGFVSNIFKSCAQKVLSGEDWRSRASEIDAIQTKTNKGLRPPKEFIGLLKTIRNLTVHHKSHEVARITGLQEDGLLNYWTDKFPKLITELYGTKHLQRCKRPLF